MAKVFDGIDAKLAEWIERQPLFFVGTAPLAADGHVNVSPKGDVRWLRILGPREVAYLDFHGSGAETIAHVRENGRIVLMLCAFSGPPRVVRLHGRASVHLPGEARHQELLAQFEPPGHPLRSLVHVEVERIADSCGFGVPLMRLEGRRPQYEAWLDNQLRRGTLDAFVENNNRASIDGLPAL